MEQTQNDRLEFILKTSKRLNPHIDTTILKKLVILSVNENGSVEMQELQNSYSNENEILSIMMDKEKPRSGEMLT